MSWIAVGVSAASGIAQIVTAGKKKKEKALEAHAANAPKYAGSQEISKYYNMSQQQANTAAQQSDLYKQQQKDIARQSGMGLSATNIAQGGQSAAAKINQSATDASMRAFTNASQQKERRMGALGQASQLMSADKMKQFQINQQQPWETKYNLLAAKAAQAAQQQQAGFANIAGAGQAAAMGAAGKKKD